MNKTKLPADWKGTREAYEKHCIDAYPQLVEALQQLVGIPYKQRATNLLRELGETT
jgi:hypothetical protein